MEYKFLEKVNSPQQLKKLNENELLLYVEELRAAITSACFENGGHLASSLGTVELCVALHYIYNSPSDKILWDVGHQAYAHKIITGRLEGFRRLRTDGGVSGFIRPAESPHDAFISGHSSNALSAAIGLFRAAKLKDEERKFVCVVGDGALTGGMSFEALNDIGASKHPILVILNDNEMSISKNVGALSQHFSKLRLSKKYRTLKKRGRKIPIFGRLFGFIKRIIKRIFRVKRNRMFEQMGFDYFGPFNGNDLFRMIDVIKEASLLKTPAIVHIVTQKGKGFFNAEQDPKSYHGLPPLAEKSKLKFSQVVSEGLCKAASENEKIAAITAAMADGTGLLEFSKKFPKRFFDVGIAEQHAVTMAAGLAKGGLKPFVCVYSSFLQRAFDQIIHDSAIDSLPVTFLLDRAGVVGEDGVTHQGVFDISYLSIIPNLTIFAPKDGNELAEMIQFSLSFDAPLAIRFPKGYKKDYGFCTPIRLGKWERFPFVEGFGKPEEEPKTDGLTKKSTKEPKKEAALEKNRKAYILAVGNKMLDIATKTVGAEIINARCVKPIDTEFLDAAIKENAAIITLEDGIEKGGFGSSVLSYINKMGGKNKIKIFAHSDEFIYSCKTETAFQKSGLTKEAVQAAIDSV